MRGTRGPLAIVMAWVLSIVGCFIGVVVGASLSYSWGGGCWSYHYPSDCPSRFITFMSLGGIAGAIAGYVSAALLSWLAHWVQKARSPEPWTEL